MALPARADPYASPEWEEVSIREEFDWHDHRIHWMSKTLPPNVEAAKDEPHHVFDWTVPARLAGQPLTIAGTLDYQPSPSEVPMPLIVTLVLLIVLGGAAVWLRLRRERRRI